MSLINFFRCKIRKIFTKENDIMLTNKVPSYDILYRKFADINEVGIYLHIPFCRQICPYCPYNKEIYKPGLANLYAKAVKYEIDIYAELFRGRPVTSFYIGGGTPTTMLDSGLYEILDYIYKKFNMKCGIHMESHPNDLSLNNLNVIKSLGIDYLSTGIEALEDKYLKFLNRPYNAKEVKMAVKRAVGQGFKCFNVDFIFALPNQPYSNIEKAGNELVKMDVDQVAAYPLFIFPYTELGVGSKSSNYNIANLIKRKNMLNILENIFYSANYRRTSVWAFTKSGIPKYCSVTIPLYVGLGASGGTYLKDIFYINTFNVSEYIKSLQDGKLPIALSIEMSERMQMSWWFYWRVYETHFKRSDFKKRFAKNFNEIFGNYIKLFLFSGFIKKDDGDQIILSDKGIFWLHALEDLFSIDYISKLWGISKNLPWPAKVSL